MLATKPPVIWWIDPVQTPEEIAKDIAAVIGPPTQERRLIAIAGPPASGKSTIAEALQKHLVQSGVATGLVPMDGFHLDNAIIEPRGLLPRKGSPETFDLAGFASLLTRLRVEDDLAVPTFDRNLDKSIGSSAMVTRDMRTIVVEGNYLLLDETGWRDLTQHWTTSVFLYVPIAELERRLQQRWLDHGLDAQTANARAMGNDIPNARRVNDNRLPADYVVA